MELELTRTIFSFFFPVVTTISLRIVGESHFYWLSSDGRVRV